MFHGKRGELRQRYREGQEDQLGSLGLVVNVIVLWNTIYMDAALNQLRGEGLFQHTAVYADATPDIIGLNTRYGLLPRPSHLTACACGPQSAKAA